MELEKREIFVSCDRTYRIAELGGRSCGLFASTRLIPAAHLIIFIVGFNEVFSGDWIFLFVNSTGCL